jgi:Fur family ferric uptake transcriptional regulator
LAAQSRNTRQKTAIREAFLRADRPLSPEEVLCAAQAEVEGLSIATVYRNIGALLDNDWLTAVAIPGEALRYEIAGKAHHHHFRCNACGKVFEMQGCDVTVRPRLPRGFRVTGHEFFLFGRCADCA